MSLIYRLDPQYKQEVELAIQRHELSRSLRYCSGDTVLNLEPRASEENITPLHYSPALKLTLYKEYQMYICVLDMNFDFLGEVRQVLLPLKEF